MHESNFQDPPRKKNNIIIIIKLIHVATEWRLN